MGDFISSHKLQVTSKKIEAITKMSFLTDVSQLRSLLGPQLVPHIHPLLRATCQTPKSETEEGRASLARV